VRRLIEREEVDGASNRVIYSSYYLEPYRISRY